MGPRWQVHASGSLNMAGLSRCFLTHTQLEQDSSWRMCTHRVSARRQSENIAQDSINRQRLTALMRVRKSHPESECVALGERASVIPAYKMVRLRDVVIQPGAKTPDNVMKNDMLCLRENVGRSEREKVHGQEGRCLDLRQRRYDRRHPEHEQCGRDHAGH